MKKIDCDGFFVDEFGNRYVRCTNCENEFSEDSILVNNDGDEVCPFCDKVGCLMDLSKDSILVNDD